MGSENSEKNNSRKGAWLTIGSFDGVHVGHKQIIGTLVTGAKADKTASVILTFFPHPAKVLRPFADPFYLTTPEEKDALLSAEGVSSVLTIKFNQQIASLTAREFMTMLHSNLRFSCLLIGYDFRLGAGREGDINVLQKIGEDLGYCVRAIEPLQSTEQIISSSIIRKYVSEGNLFRANELLGYRYSISGEVIHGDGRGKHIGIPTANIEPWPEKLIPGHGVYAVMAELGGRLYQAVVNIGNRPTFYQASAQPTIEVHILDFSRDVYGSQMKLYFVDRIRDEVKFNSADELMLQIRKDISDAWKALKNAG